MTVDSQMKSRPDYEALDGNGIAYVRRAMFVHELPDADRRAALEEAVHAIAKLVGVEIVAPIKMATPVFTCLKGMNRNIAKRHPQSALLLTNGERLSLDFCQSYLPDGFYCSKLF